MGKQVANLKSSQRRKSLKFMSMSSMLKRMVTARTLKLQLRTRTARQSFKKKSTTCLRRNHRKSKTMLRMMPLKQLRIITRKPRRNMVSKKLLLKRMTMSNLMSTTKKAIEVEEDDETPEGDAPE